MKKLFLLFCFSGIFGLILFSANFVFSAAATCEEYCENQELGEPPDKTCICNPLEAKSFAELIENIIKFIFNLALWIAPIMFIIAGFYYITATGDPAKIQTAKNIILYTVIGLIIVISARGLVVLFETIFEVK